VINRRVIERCVLTAFAVFMLAVPWLVPALVNTFWVSVIAEILIWSLFAASVNLLFGYVGLLSFGQALFFGFGMYGVGIGIDLLHLSFWPAFGLGISAAILMALVSGIFAVRLTWHYFAIITVVFSLIFYFLALSNKWLTGGDDGINFTLPPTFALGGTSWSLTDPTFQYFFILATVALCFWLMHRLVGSPLGKAFLAIRDNDVRAALIGLDVYRLRLLAFVMAGFLAGVAGALFAFFGRYASASYMFYHVSGEAVVWAIVGGAGTLFGPVIGTSLFIIIRELVSTSTTRETASPPSSKCVIVCSTPLSVILKFLSSKLCTICPLESRTVTGSFTRIVWILIVAPDVWLESCFWA